MKLRFSWVSTRRYLYNVFRQDGTLVAADVEVHEDENSGTWSVLKADELGPYSTETQAKIEYEKTLEDE